MGGREGEREEGAIEGDKELGRGRKSFRIVIKTE